jgi:hypothetical protein
MQFSSMFLLPFQNRIFYAHLKSPMYTRSISSSKHSRQSRQTQKHTLETGRNTEKIAIGSSSQNMLFFFLVEEAAAGADSATAFDDLDLADTGVFDDGTEFDDLDESADDSELDEVGAITSLT